MKSLKEPLMSPQWHVNSPKFSQPLAFIALYFRRHYRLIEEEGFAEAPAQAIVE